MILESSAFDSDGSIPRVHTCDGRDTSPPLSWTKAPEGTESFALIVDDPDAPGKTFVHWVVFDLSARARELPQGIAPGSEIAGGGRQGVNDFGKVGYGGPCPPSGTHRYAFTLYAVREKLGLKAGATKQDVLRAMEGRTLAEAQLTGRYSRK